QDLLQYFISFGQIGLIGVLLLGLLNAAFGKIMLSLGSYYRADNHEEVFTQISHPIITRILDFVLIAGSFIMGFVMIAGAGSNLEQQFGLPFWIGGLICSLLIITVSFMNFDKITNVLGVFTPIMIVMIFIITGYSFIGKSHAIAHTIKPATSNVWFSVINYYSLCAMTAVSMAFILGGSVVRIGIAEKGGTRGGLLVGLVVFIAAISIFANLDTVKDADLPILAIANQIHPWLAYIYAITVFSLIFNTAFSLFYSIARRFANGSTKRMRIVIISVVIIGYICSFFGFKDLISILYPILGYMGLLLLIILIYGWLRDRKDIIMEKLFRRKMLHLSLKKHSPHKNLSEKERELFHTLGDISQADTKSLKEDIHNEAKEILSNTETVQELKDYVEEHLSIDEEVIHQNINILQEQQEESKSTESSKDRPIKKSNINNNEVK
ncbi:MAG: hypothetical protein KHW53_05295, partial [Veillonella sp.]|uniref:YkvI family membrane protein n=1 Tax=Veillonella sp. TaxID=1926307 RepID=UPI00257D3C09